MDPTFETVQLDGNDSIRSLHFQCEAFQQDHSWHYHPQCELAHIVRGAGTRYVGDSVETFQPGDLVFIGPNIPHCWVSDPDQHNNEMQVLQFDPACLGNDFLRLPEASPLAGLLQQAKRGLHFDGGQLNPILDLLTQIEQQRGLYRLSLFVQLLDQLCQATGTSPLTSEVYVVDNSQFHSARLNKVMDYLKRNLQEEIKQTDVADLVHMTPQSFSRFFRATTGRTFVSFVNLMRITEACRQLASSDDDIMDIAFRCGYANLSNFNRRFVEIKQVTPSEYRRQQRQLVSN
ncbi:helix-turn-helix transcriptional regulator [Pseudomaricurvus alkylphenolicus]|uniref:helix-turn-helix domain-containing protein n=1 Tax=Pseudomaricurvus alkylphenolicus TaxID=1306991 RepID=UPI0014221C37|nr:AraC family transcriptional regulator [Pseudomaricurvus alkylphenolicus]NIB39941.1 helix-turn-helix transcriptional regulator [Pseudomaricurvus alkylphenolicus]